MRAKKRAGAGMGWQLPADADAANAVAAPSARADIIFTAERTNRSLQDTASSIAVVTGEDAEALAGAQSTYDLLERVPNVVATRGANSAPAVRGIDGAGPAVGGNAFFAGTRPRPTFLLDWRALTPTASGRLGQEGGRPG